MKRLISFFVMICLLMSMLSATPTVVSAADSDTEPAETGYDNAPDGYTDIRYGQTKQEETDEYGGTVYKYKVTAAKSGIVSITTECNESAYLDVKTSSGERCSYINYSRDGNKYVYYYAFSAGHTYLLDVEVNSYGDTANLSTTVSEYTAGTPVLLGQVIETSVDAQDQYYVFKPDHDMIAAVYRRLDKNISVDVCCESGTISSLSYFSLWNDNRTARVFSFTAGTEYFFRVSQYGTVSEAKNARFIIEECDTIGVNETKHITYDSSNSFVRSYVFTPTKDMFISVTPSNINNPNIHWNFCSMLTEITEYGGKDVFSETDQITHTVKVYAGKTYLVSQYFTDFEGVSSDVTLEEYTTPVIGINEEVQMGTGSGTETYQFVPDRDTRVSLQGRWLNGRHNISFYDSDMKAVKAFNGSSPAVPFYEVQKGKVYYVVAEKNYNAYMFCLREIAAQPASLNQEYRVTLDICGYSFYRFTPDSDMVVSFYTPSNKEADVTVFDGDLNMLSDFYRKDYSFDLVGRDKTYIGEESCFFLKKGIEYLFCFYCVEPDKAAAFCINEKTVADIELGTYQSLYTHVTDEYLFFRYTAEEDMLLEKRIMQEEDDYRKVSFVLYDSDFKALSENFDHDPYPLKKGKTYYFVGQTDFDIDCDDLDCGVTLSSHEIPPISDNETVSAFYGDQFVYSPDRECIVDITANMASAVKLYDSSFNEISWIYKDSSPNRYLHVNAGEAYYLKCLSEEENIEITVRLVAEVDPLRLNEKKTVTISQADEVAVFSFTPEYDFVGEFNYSDESDREMDPVANISEGKPDFSLSNWYDDFGEKTEFTAGNTYFFVTGLYAGWSDVETGSFCVELRDTSRIATEQTVTFNEHETDHLEQSVLFVPEQDMRVLCEAESYAVSTETVGFRVTDKNGDVIAEAEGDTGASQVFTVKKGEAYSVTITIHSDGSYCDGSLSLSQVRDIKIGDKVTHAGLYRFVPKNDVIPGLLFTYSDGSRGYESITVYDEEMEYLRADNDFGGSYLELSANVTYYLSIPEYTQSEDEDTEDEDTEDDVKWTEIRLAEPETLRLGDTKPLALRRGDWIYRLSCDRETIVKLSGAGTGSCLAVLRNGSGRVYKNNFTTDSALFSIGYTIPEGENLYLVIFPYEDLDAQISMKAQDEFEIIDNKLVRYNGNRSEPSIPRVTEIGDSAFLYSDPITKITVPDSVTKLGAYSFARCYSLREVSIPGSVKTIGKEAFTFDINLKKVTMGAGITAIQDGAFLMCSGLDDMQLPGTLTTIGSEAFLGCGSINDVTIPASVTSIGDKAFGYYESDSGIAKYPGFTIRGYKGTAAEKYANDNGFTFIDLGSTVPIPGDINGDKKVDKYDVSLLQQYLNQCDVTIRTDNADVNGDGKINMKDIVLLQQFLNGWNVRLV